jgi:hypothetical protein
MIRDRHSSHVTVKEFIAFLSDGWRIQSDVTRPMHVRTGNARRTEAMSREVLCHCAH